MEVTQADITKMTGFWGEIHDPRRHQGNFRHNLIDILVIGLSAVISGQDEFEAMEELRLARESWFKTFLENYRMKYPMNARLSVFSGESAVSGD